MGFFHYEKAVRKYRDQPDMLETIKRLHAFDAFHCLRDSSLLLAGKASDRLPCANPQYLSWLTVCSGGLLFDTTLVSITAEDPIIGVEFDTLDELNSTESQTMFMLPDGYYVIAVRSYGDPICLSKEDQRVYLWDCEHNAFTTIWEDFNNFLTDEVDTALELIANGDLDPIPCKTEEDAM